MTRTNPGNMSSVVVVFKQKRRLLFIVFSILFLSGATIYSSSSNVDLILQSNKDVTKKKKLKNTKKNKEQNKQTVEQVVNPNTSATHNVLRDRQMLFFHVGKTG